MSQLYFVTRPGLVPGFQLAGVDAHGAEDAETAQEMIAGWLDSGETGLIAIDDGLLERMDVRFLKRLSESEGMLYLPIPGGKPLGPEASQRSRITALIHKAIGFHITFKGGEEGGEP